MPVPDDPDDDHGFVPPLHPDDRLWRHPSEVAAARRTAGGDVVGQGSGEASRAERALPVGAPRAWSVAAASLLVGVAATLAVLSVTGTFDRSRVRTVVEQVETDLSGGDAGEAHVASTVGPALVRIDASRPSGAVTATGVVFRSDGHLLTTADAVEGATSVNVTTADGTVLPGTVVGVDTTSDIAVVDVDRNGMPVAVIGRLAGMQAGTPAVALERQPGASTASVAAGHVSALGLRLDTTDGGSLHDMIQASLEMTPSSGGAVLCSEEGAVLGLATARQPAPAARYTPTATNESSTSTTSAPAGTSTLYATPIDYAAQVADEIIATGTVRHTWLGVLGDDLDPATAATIGRSGATLTRVVADGPAASAGLREGDVVLAVDGVQVTSMSSLVVALRTHHDGDAVTVTYLRDGAQLTADVTLTSRA